jgi:hypothetical protein
MIDCDAKKPYTIVKHAWCPEARDALRDTFYTDGEEIAQGVLSGRMELFRVNDDSWAVTEIMRGMLFIWCYAGRGSNQFVDRMRVVARLNKLSQVSFFSRHKGAARLWKRFNPRMIPTYQPGEVQYVFEVPA